MRRLLLFEHRFLCNVGRNWWDNFVSNSEVRRQLLGSRFLSLKQAPNYNRLGYLGHALHGPTERLLLCTMFFEVGNDRKVSRCTRVMTRKSA